jgi:hypothetical protein
VCACACVHVCARALVCVRVCVRACMRARVRDNISVKVGDIDNDTYISVYLRISVSRRYTYTYR